MYLFYAHIFISISALSMWSYFDVNHTFLYSYHTGAFPFVLTELRYVSITFQTFWTLVRFGSDMWIHVSSIVGFCCKFFSAHGTLEWLLTSVLGHVTSQICSPRKHNTTYRTPDPTSFNTMFFFPMSVHELFVNKCIWTDCTW